MQEQFNADASRALFEAVLQSDGLCATLAIDANADLNVARASDHARPLHVAAELSSTTIMRALLDPAPPIIRAEIEALDIHKRTALLSAAAAGADLSIELLIAAPPSGSTRSRANVNAADDQLQTALHIAAADAKRKLVMDMLLGATPAPALDAIDVTGATPLAVAAGAGVIHAAESLIKAGAAVDKPDHLGHRATHRAAQAGSLKIVRALLAAGADIDAADEDHHTPLHEAAFAGHADICTELLDSDTYAPIADVNARTVDGDTPLHLASASGSLPVVDVLMEADSPVVDVCIQNKRNLAAYDVAAESGNVRARLETPTTQCPVGCAAGQYGNLVQRHCTMCPAGSRCASNVALPELCPRGQYQPKKGMQNCLSDCAAGSFVHGSSGKAVISGATTCTECPVGHSCAELVADPLPCGAGEYQSKRAQTKCEACAAGHYTMADGGDVTAKATTCVECNVGFACPGDGTHRSCLGDEYSDATAAAACARCDPGHFTIGVTNGVNTGCRSCQPGSFSIVVARECKACPRGEYQDEQGGVRCKADCKPGGYISYQDGTPTTTGGAACMACPVGHECPDSASPPVACTGDTYTDTDGQALCKECPLGKYVSTSEHEAANVACDPCPAGKHGVVGATCAACAPGSFTGEAGQTVCTDCPRWSYQPDYGQPACRSCPDDHEQLIHASTTTCEYCPLGQYRADQSGTAVCLRCANLAKDDLHYCVAHTDEHGNEYVIAEACGEGYYRPRPTECRKCAADETCTGGGAAPKWHFIFSFNTSLRSGVIIISLLTIGIVAILVGISIAVFTIIRRRNNAEYKKLLSDEGLNLSSSLADEPL